VLLRKVLTAAILVGAPALAQAQSTSATLMVTATVVSTCRVDVQRSAEISVFGTMPVSVTCAKGAARPHVQRPVAPHREVHEAVLTINF